MPAPGDQHSDSKFANPFEPAQKRMSEYTAQEIATLQSRLEKQLGPEYISSRAGPSGQKVHYIAAEKCISLANEVFGFNGWSSSIQDLQVDFVDEDERSHRISLGLSVVVRVTLRDGTYHEDIGYGHIENCKGKAAAFEKAKKEATTDALKRALRNFGNVLGNCIYDKAYLAKVTKLKVEPTKFSADNLHRHSDYAIKQEPKENETTVSAVPAPPPPRPALVTEDSFEDFLGELDEADFNITEDGHPDEIVLPGSTTERPQNNPPQNNIPQSNPPQNTTTMPPPGANRSLMRAGSGGQNFPRQPQTPNQHPAQRPNTMNSFNGAQNKNMANNIHRPPPNQFNQNRPAAHNPAMNQNAQPPRVTPPPPQPQAQPQAGAGGPPPGEAVGFFSARAVKDIPEESLVNGQVVPKAGQVFNPRLESPSIRKTPGIDHTKSKPVSRSGQHVPPAVTGGDADSGGQGQGTASGPGGSIGMSRPAPGVGAPRGPGNVINPQFDQARRIGAPGASSPLANRGQYRPPTFKRPAPAAENPAGRIPLTEMPNNGVPTGGGAPGNVSGPDVKRQKTS
ncbi:hypothetical protein V8F20_012284 [Naviculisporaceae sp. PSN 640]